MVSLENRIRNFKQFQFPRYREKFETLKYGQQPHTLFITCSDSRILPHLITDSDPGELFVIRNAGNIVPAFDSMEFSVAASIEYAVSALNVSNIVVCGHSHCGAMQGLLDPKSVETLPTVNRWIKNSQDVLFDLDDVPKSSQLDHATKENVILQLSNLRTYPFVRQAECAGTLNLRGWVYQFETGDVLELDEAVGKFAPVVERDIFPANESEPDVSEFDRMSIENDS